jgi:hypothetical protein
MLKKVFSIFRKLPGLTQVPEKRLHESKNLRFMVDFYLFHARRHCWLMKNFFEASAPMDFQARFAIN